MRMLTYRGRWGVETVYMLYGEKDKKSAICTYVLNGWPLRWMAFHPACTDISVVLEMFEN